MWSQSAPQSSMRWASEAKLAKSEDNIDGAIFAFTPIFSDHFATLQGIWKELLDVSNFKYGVVPLPTHPEYMHYYC